MRLCFISRSLRQTSAHFAFLALALSSPLFAQNPLNDPHFDDSLPINPSDKWAIDAAIDPQYLLTADSDFSPTQQSDSQTWGVSNPQIPKSPFAFNKIATVPEPSTIFFLAAGLSALAACNWSKRQP
ncbi:MAG: PEP-CTERM sorting domain-containing protein [Verrucomicrobiota bacterium]